MNWFSRPSNKTVARPSVGPGKRVFAIGDIHGRRDLLDKLLLKIEAVIKAAPQADDVLVFLGDYIDRGANSKAVIERLSTLKLSGCRTIFLRGNHDQTLLDFMRDANVYRAWRNFGAPETLLSYGVKPPRFDSEEDFARARREFATAFPQSHLDFINGLEYSHNEDDYFFVHAGVRPGLPLDEQAPEDMLWIRDEFLTHRRSFGKVVIHGHSPSDEPVKLFNRVGVDTGAHATDCLTAVILYRQEVLFLDTRPNILLSMKPEQHQVLHA